MSLVQARHRSHWPIKDSGHGEAQRDYSAGPLRTRVLCALALHAFSGRCELTDLLASRFGGAVLERPLPYSMPLAWPTGAKYYHQWWALAGGGGVRRYILVLNTQQKDERADGLRSQGGGPK